MQGLYVHIPFCDRICRYCDFAKVYTDVFDHMDYVKSLKREYELYQQKNTFNFDTVYFGGGTPSALSVEALEYLLLIFTDEINSAVEVTFEANPESLTEEKIELLKKYGVNRVSLGVQTFDASQLHFLNRLHTAEEVYKSFKLLRKHGLTNINLDLIYALPNQTISELEADLKHIEILKPTHISTYALIFEPHTRLFLNKEAGLVQEVGDEMQELMYTQIQKELLNQGYEQYEFSNWAKSGKLSKHNTKYWKLTEYIGLGVGSHGFLNNMRYGNTRSIVKYTELIGSGKFPYSEEHLVTKKELMEEMMFLGLRLTQGVSEYHFNTYFNEKLFEIFEKPLSHHINAGNIIYEQGNVKLSNEALFISNDILSDFLLDE